MQTRAKKKKFGNGYVESFKQGAYNYIREDYDPLAEETIVRKYFAGGFAFRHAGDVAQMINEPAQLPPDVPGNAIVLPTDMVMAGKAPDTAETSYQDLQDFPGAL